MNYYLAAKAIVDRLLVGSDQLPPGEQALLAVALLLLLQAQTRPAPVAGA